MRFCSKSLNAEKIMPKPIILKENEIQIETPSTRVEDLTGQDFNKLRVLGYAGAYQRHSRWLCQCQCGNIINTTSDRLKRCATQSCGCLKRITTSGISKKFPLEYSSFSNAKARCRNQNANDYHLYGGRGIEFRFNSFEEFLAEVGFKPSATHSIDRINNNGHYEKGNVRWATMSEQNRNRRNNRLITIDGVVRCVQEWSEILGITHKQLWKRMRLGWCQDCAIQSPIGVSCPHRPPTKRNSPLKGRQGNRKPPMVFEINIEAGRGLNKYKTHCKKGHPFTPENTAFGSRGAGNHAIRRVCITCKREWARNRKKELNCQNY